MSIKEDPFETSPAPIDKRKDVKNLSSMSPLILVTGATGFLGAYIVKNLIIKGYSVRAIRRKSGFPFFIEKEIIEKADWVNGDILDVGFLKEALHGVDGIIHAAAMVSFSKEDRSKMYTVNIEGTANVVNMALENNVKSLVHISSVAALGRSLKTEVINEAKKWEDNSSNTHYAITKHHSEMHVWRAFAEGLGGNIMNPATVLGFGNWHQSSCVIFRSAYNEFPWFTNGINGFVGVEDVAEAAVQLLQSDILHKRFIVNAENWSFQQLFNSLADHFHKKRPGREAGPLLSEIAWRLEKFKALINGKPPILTRENAKLAQSKSSFSNLALLEALPGFTFRPLDKVIEMACVQYVHALENGTLTL